MCMCVCVCLSVCDINSSHCALFLLHRLIHSTKLFDSPDDAITTAAACFGEGLRAGGGVVFKLKWRRYIRNNPMINMILMVKNIASAHEGKCNTS